MKTILQLNLDSTFNKNYYRIKKNCLLLTKQNPHIQYPFDNICYQYKDVNSSIIYDIIVDYSNKNKIMGSTQSTASINIDQSCKKIDKINNNQKQVLIMSQMSNTVVDQNYKQPQFNYVIMFDQIVENQSIQSLIKQLSTTQIFKKQDIKIGHFLIHQNGIYDFHRTKADLTQTQRQQLQKQNQQIRGSIEDNFMWIYNKQINLCQQIKLNNIPHLPKTISYIQANDFNHLHQPTLGLQLATNLTKAQDIKHKELQNKKILQVYIVNIGQRLRVTMILLNYNKNYSMNAEESKQFNQLLTMHGTLVGEIKYQTVKVEILNKLMKNSQKLFYVMYFPGPKLHAFSTDPNQMSTNLTSSMINRSSATQKQNKTNNIFISNNSQLMMTRNSNSSNKRQAISSNNSNLQSSKVSQYSKINNSSDKLKQNVTNMFTNYQALMTKDRDNLQKIIKDYLVKKEDNLKNQLQKVKERVKQLKLSHRVQECEVIQLKNKCTKALQKMSQSIIDLQRMGISNVQRHMDWLKSMIDQKKYHIKEQQQQIQQINKKIIEGRKSHQYFYKKMIQFRDKLKQKQLQLTKKNIKNYEKLNKVQTQGNNKQNNHHHQRSNLTQLSTAQLEQLEQYKQKLKTKLVQKLKNSSEKKSFFDTLGQIKNKVTKLELAKLQQKYFDLLHD